MHISKAQHVMTVHHAGAPSQREQQLAWLPACHAAALPAPPPGLVPAFTPSHVTKVVTAYWF